MNEKRKGEEEIRIESDPPVTVLVTRKPLPGKEAEFEEYIRNNFV